MPKKVAYVKSDVRECSVYYKQGHFCYSLRSHSEEESRMNSQQITHLISQDTHAAAHEEGLEVLEEVLEEALSADSLLEDPEADSPEADNRVVAVPEEGPEEGPEEDPVEVPVEDPVEVLSEDSPEADSPVDTPGADNHAEDSLADSLSEDLVADSPEADSVVADAVDTLADSPAADSHAEDTVAGSSHVAGSVVGSLEAPSAQGEADAHTRMGVANPAACAV